MTEFARGSFVAAVLDTETTGLDAKIDQVIEIAIQLVSFEMPEGKITAELESYSALQDPGFEIPAEIQQVTGIATAMVRGRAIDWKHVDAILGRADIIVAHNARFDRGFVEPKSEIARRKPWGCSAFDIDWRGKGFANAKLGDLCGALGIEFQAHRAMSDVRAVMRLIDSEDAFTRKPYLAELAKRWPPPLG